MQSRIHGFALAEPLSWRVWNDVVADVWDVYCAPDAYGTYVSPDPRLFVALELSKGSAFELGIAEPETVVSHSTPLSMSYVPAGLSVDGRALNLKRIRHLDLHFSESAVTRRFGKALSRDRLLLPRLNFTDVRMAALAVAIAEECANPDPQNDLYGESLATALLALLFDIRQENESRRPGLSRFQLKTVTDYIEDHCLEPIRLLELANLAGLSETYFSHAFKASTGVPPHRWQMQARICKVQHMLTLGDRTLSEVAAAAGFSDQAHFTRVFKKVVGLTPADWRRDSAS